MVFSLSTKRTNTISQTMTTPTAMSAAATQPDARENRLTTWTNLSIKPPRLGIYRAPGESPDRTRIPLSRASIRRYLTL